MTGSLNEPFYRASDQKVWRMLSDDDQILTTAHYDTPSKLQSPSTMCWVGYIWQGEMAIRRCGSPFWNSYSAVTGRRFILVIHRATTMWWHHSTGLPNWTLSMTLSNLLHSKLSFTCPYQYNEIGVALCLATGVTLSLRWIATGGPAMTGSAWWEQMLNL